jgi:hypothetical protein
LLRQRFPLVIGNRILGRAGKTFIEWIAAIAVSIVLAVASGELLLRFMPLKVPPILNAVYFSEHPEQFRDQHNEFGYQPFSYNREGAVYSNYSDAWVEFDAEFMVNNAGLVQRRPINSSEQYTAVVGDSFLHGLGSTPWFYDLEQDLPAALLANLGVPGAGVQHWQKAVEWFEHAHATVEKVVVILIADDLFRPYWVARANKQRIAFCHTERCDNVFIKHQSVDPDILIQYWYEQSQWGPTSNQWFREKVRALVVKLRLGQWAINFKRSLMASKARNYFDANKKSFEDLLAHHTVAVVLHLPEKHEALSHKWSHESFEVRAFFQDIGVNYVDGMERCRLTGADFYRFDDHPNTMGYEKIRHCVANLLKVKTS